MSYETLLTSVTDGVARITLNRPEVRNALSRAMVSELEQALAAYEADAGARVIVLAGAGDTAFCAGADLKGAGDRGRRSRRVNRSAAWRASSNRWRGCERR